MKNTGDRLKTVPGGGLCAAEPKDDAQKGTTQDQNGGMEFFKALTDKHGSGG